MFKNGARPATAGTSRPEVSPSAIELILILCATNEALFNDVARLIEPDDLYKEEETALKAVWAGMLQSKELVSGLSFESVCYYTDHYLKTHPLEATTLPQEAVDAIYRPDPSGLIYSIAYPDIPASPENIALARRHLQNLSYERDVFRVIQNAVSAPYGGVNDITDVLNAAKEHIVRITATSAIPKVDVAPPFGTQLAPAANYLLTGMPFIDNRLGGQRVGDVNGILGPTGGGKAQPLDAIVMTSRGPKPMGDIVVGEVICDPMGGYTRVTGVFPQGKLDAYEIVFSDGSTTRCCGDHLWKVDSVYNGWRGRVMSTDELRKQLKSKTGAARYSIGLTAPVDFEHQSVMLDPYLIGTIMGRMGKYAYEKAIPDEYLYTDAASRWALLQGLMDTDGYVMARVERPDRCRLEYTTTSYQLHKQFVWLVQSLGGLATVTIKKTKKYRDAYRICVKMDDSAKCFRLPRKKRLCSDRRKAQGKKHPVKRLIKDIRAIGAVECQCISVDSPSKLYLTDNFIVTHNTTLALDMALQACKQSLIESLETGKPPAQVIFLTAEESAEKLRPRLWSNWFNIPRDFLERNADWEEYSRPGALKPYELQMYQGSPAQFSEVERYNMFAEQLSKTLVLLDISGNTMFPDAGNFGLKEITSLVVRAVDEYGIAPRAVFVDYAGLIVERQLTSSRDPAKDLQFKLKRFADEFRKDIIEKVSSTGWLLHQLKGEAAEFSPTKELTMADAGSCKDFAVNMAVCMMLGVPDPHTGCRILHMPKTRYRGPNMDTQPHKVLLQIHNQFSRMVDVSTEFSVDAATRQFLPVNELRSIGGMGM